MKNKIIKFCFFYYSFFVILSFVYILSPRIEAAAETNIATTTGTTEDTVKQIVLKN